MESYLVVSFPSVSHALAFEKLLISLGKTVKLLPVPRVISSSCGIAARLPLGMESEIAQIVSSGRAEVERVYLFTAKGRNTEVMACQGPWDEYGRF